MADMQYPEDPQVEAEPNAQPGPTPDVLLLCVLLGMNIQMLTCTVLPRSNLTPCGLVAVCVVSGRGLCG